MFDPAPPPRVFAVAPGADFPAMLVQGLRARLGAFPPEAMARVEILVNTARLQTRLREAFFAQGPGFLPRIRLITDLTQNTRPLAIRLELARLIRGLLRREPDLAPPTAAFALAESLFDLLDELQAEGVLPQRLERLDVSHHSQHWERSLRFLRLVRDFTGPASGVQAQLAQATAALADSWRVAPPRHPIIVAGSTGSRGSTAALMRLVARQPQGALVLPGFDMHLPAALLQGMDDPLLHEDHPQFRFARLLRDLDLPPDEVRPWVDTAPPDERRNALVSLALRPAPVTDQWIVDGPALGDLRIATQAVTLIEANDARSEAQAIALCLRDAVVQGRKAALITPDRTLARRVTAILDRWSLRPDDSAGRPLGQSAPGRLLRQTAAALAEGIAPDTLIALLKNPLIQNGEGRGQHLLHLRDLELHLRGRFFADISPARLALWAGQHLARADWLKAMQPLLVLQPDGESLPLAQHLLRHLSLVEGLATSPGASGTGVLWLEPAGEAAARLVADLQAQADTAGDLTPREYLALLESLLAAQQVREAGSTHPDLSILGTLEARAQGADLVILGGLNEGVWPAVPPPDPWFNRTMRRDAGLALPERQIGLSAHDFQQAAGAPRVVLSRARRDADAETIPSRWLNRLVNLVAGLPRQSGPEALAAMRARGDAWLRLGAALDADLTAVPPAIAARNPRPAPAPPEKARLRELSVTRIETLIRDPFAIYAERILRLRVLEPLSPGADPRLKGTILHRIPALYVQRHPPGGAGSVADFLAIADTVLAEDCPWHWVRAHWRARLERIAPAFVAWNRALPGLPVVTERRGALVLPQLGFTLTGQPDRIDRDADGRLHLYDYKTGSLPSKGQIDHFNKQLVLLALMAEDDAFGVGAAEVAKAAFIGLGSAFDQREVSVDADSLRSHRETLIRLLARYRDPAQGFTARRAVDLDGRPGDYDALARRGEWQPGDAAVTLPVGDHDE